MRKLLYTLVFFSLIFVAACTTSVKEAAVSQPYEEDLAIEQNSDLKLLTGTTSKYYRFDKVHYENSLKEGKIIFLDFYANWCPICKIENPSILAAFNELNNENVVGYRVHFNDGETNADDQEMAKKYGVTYQHTKVILDKNGNVALKSLEVFSKDEVIDGINKVLGG